MCAGVAATVIPSPRAHAHLRALDEIGVASPLPDPATAGDDV